MDLNLTKICNHKVIFSCFLAVLSVSMLGTFVTYPGITTSIAKRDIPASKYENIEHIQRYGSGETVVDNGNSYQNSNTIAKYTKSTDIEIQAHGAEFTSQEYGKQDKANRSLNQRFTTQNTSLDLTSPGYGNIVVQDTNIGSPSHSYDTHHDRSRLTTPHIGRLANGTMTTTSSNYLNKKKSFGKIKRGKAGRKVYAMSVPSRIFKTKEQLDVHGMRDAVVKRAASPTSGEPWPTPKGMDLSGAVLRVHPTKFRLVVSDSLQQSCDILSEAVQNYNREIERFWNYSQDLHKNGAKTYSRNDSGQTTSYLYKVDIFLEDIYCTDIYPPVDMNESYSLSVGDGVGKLSAKEVWGVLRGLETFFQLLYVPLMHDGTLHLQAVDIQDEPAYPHRGLLLDTSRHFLSKHIILQNIDAMRQSKLNVFHWHMVDDQSFPYQSKKFPDLWKKGAYAPNLVYSFDDIKEIIDYARLRGIRVMPEFDTPGHTRSWLGQPGLLAECGSSMERSTGVFDVTKESTYTFLRDFYTELRSVFKDNVTHVGGDEVSTKCWFLNRGILSHLENKTQHQLINQYFTRLHSELKSIDKNWVTMVWYDLIKDSHIQLDPKQTWVQVWLHADWVTKSMTLGLNTIYSGCWYLDSVNGLIPDWYKFYNCFIDKLQPNEYDPNHGRLMGGEVCMWGEWVDDNNVIQMIWPRAIAAAERLWSNPAFTSHSRSVQSRFQEQACRMWRRGIPVGPHNGPGHCSGKMPYDPDRTSYRSQWPEAWRL